MFTAPNELATPEVVITSSQGNSSYCCEIRPSIKDKAIPSNPVHGREDVYWMLRLSNLVANISETKFSPDSANIDIKDIFFFFPPTRTSHYV